MTNFKRDIPMYAVPYLQGPMNMDDLVSKLISLRDVNDGYAALKDGSLTRVVVTSFGLQNPYQETHNVNDGSDHRERQD